MGDPVIYLRGPFGAGPDFGIPPSFVADAKSLLDFDDAEIDAIAVRLESSPEFLSREALEQLLANATDGSEHGERLARVLLFADARREDQKESPEKLFSKIEAWVEADDKESEPLSPEQVTELRPRFLRFVKRYPGLRRRANAARVRKATGMPLEDIQLICDARPVYDEKWTQIEGMIPLTTLKVVCTAASGMPVALEAVLSQKQVDDLAEKAKTAKAKLAVLKGLLDDKNVRHVDAGTSEGEA